MTLSNGMVLTILSVLLSACGVSGQEDRVARENSASSALPYDLIERLSERSSPAVSEEAAAPSFVIDPSWPKPLPHNWRIGQVGGLAVDKHDNIWVYHRPRSLDPAASAALGVAGKDFDGNLIDGLGNSRVYGEQVAGCCVPAPSVLKFDRAGNLLGGWGGPQDPGFLQKECRVEDGCVWPGVEHGIFVDHNDFVYISGNGGVNGRAPWAGTHGQDSHVLKFTAEGKFIYQIGRAGAIGPDSDQIGGGRNGSPQPFKVADMTVDPKGNRLYIADGYGNRRILIVDAETGRYIGHFGAYGQNPVKDPDPIVLEAPPYEPGPWARDYHAGNLRPPFFRSPVHCVEISTDGYLYVCDRSNARIQVFDVNRVGAQCANPEGETGRCGFVKDIHVAPQTMSGLGTAGTVAFSRDPRQSCLYVGDLANGTVYVINRENAEELDRIGRPGRQVGEFHWLHVLDVDSQGNLYTGEVDSGQRIQRFARYGASGCSGKGNPKIGLYSANR